MPENRLLQQAIAAARAGHELTAREIFLRVVEAEPRNELAWLWLAGLLDSVDDRIMACETLLCINPGNQYARIYLGKLQKEKQGEIDKQRCRQDELLRQAQELVAADKRSEALAFLDSTMEKLADRVEAWRLVACLTHSVEQKTQSLEKVLELDPQDAQVRQELRYLHHFQDNLFDLAKMYEEHGKFDKAISTYQQAAYQQAATQTKSDKQWDAVYQEISRLEKLKREKIVYVSPQFSIARLSVGPFILYVTLMFIQVGIDPFAHPNPFLWLGAFWALLGGFLIAVASVPFRHRLWLQLFDDASSGGSRIARFTIAATGWILVILPHVLLVADAYYRLQQWFIFISQ